MAGSFQDWIPAASGVNSAVQSLAIIGGGLWALHRFGLHREKEPALEIGIASRTKHSPGGGHLAIIDATLTNTGKVKLRANQKRGDRAYNDGLEELKYSVSLIVRHVDENCHTGQHLSWFNEEKKAFFHDEDYQIDLVRDYCDKPDMTDFFLEPGETYALSAAIYLDPGLYMAMVTFIGLKHDDFWRRTAIVEVG